MFEEGLNSEVKLSLYRTFGKIRSISVVLVMLGQDYWGQERMDSMKSWAGIEAGRSVCCVMQSVRVLVMCCGIVLHMLALEVCWSSLEIGLSIFRVLIVLRSHLMS